MTKAQPAAQTRVPRTRTVYSVGEALLLRAREGWDGDIRREGHGG